MLDNDDDDDNHENNNKFDTSDIWSIGYNPCNTAVIFTYLLFINRETNGLYE